ncbi:MAG: ATP-grasp domain-containing protein [Muribaculaceae bacterium]|nr:ATP-grasp domain-containing protein [Muribaculaceae bacterium]
MKKKLMLLGGLRYLLPVIEVAHRHGIHVITVDYLPDNIAHKYSDEYHNVSIIDKEAVLALARELQIDGIMSFAVDPGVVAAAYTAEQMGLPFQCSYEAACILQDKSRFRQFLADNGFNVPNARGYNECDDALQDINYFNWPVIVKPVDSAGSKGVTRVDDPADLPAAIAHALDCSPSRHYIIEDFLEKMGPSMGDECFVVDGKLLYNAFYDQFFDNEAVNPFAPSGEFWPSAMSKEHEQEFKSDLQRLFDLLHVTTGMFNVECRVCTNGKAYLMEVSPRAGGNRLAEILNYAADVDIIDAEVCASVGLPLPDVHEPNYNGYYAINVLHSEHDGTFKDLCINSDFERDHLVERDLWVKPGDKVSAFTGANQSLGTIFLRFDTRETLDRFVSAPNSYISIVTQ